MPFFNREKEKKELKAILSGEPNVLWFIYGPINSGKTALITRVCEELSDDYIIFYINFRGVETRKYEDFVRALFQPKDESFFQKLVKKTDIIEAALEYGEKLIKKINYHFEVPTRVLKLFFQPEPERDVFKYLEVLMKRLNEKGKKPALIFDELQMLKEVKKNGSVLHDLFNFLVRMTKETHLCHCLCATSDCLFIEEIYKNAHLEGRMKSFLVDDLSKEEAFKIYEAFGFEEKELIWDYIGGKIGDMVLVFEEKKRGWKEEKILKTMLKDTTERLDALLEEIEFGSVKIQFKGREQTIEVNKVKEVLSLFKEKEEVSKREIDPGYRNYLVNENVLFFDPMKGTVRPQGRLILRAIREVV